MRGTPRRDPPDSMPVTQDQIDRAVGEREPTLFERFRVAVTGYLDRLG